MKQKKLLLYAIMVLLLLLFITPQLTTSVYAAPKTYLDYKREGDSTKELRFRMKEYIFYKGEKIYDFVLLTSYYWDVMPSIKYTSSNKKVVTVNSDGDMKAVGKGTTTITGTYTKNNKKYTFKTKVKVIAPDGSSSGNDFFYDLINGEIEITGIKNLEKPIKKLVVPEYIDGYRVTRIGDSAFLGEDITSASIPAGIRYMDKSIFYGCKKLESVKIAAQCKAIGDETFSGCKKLKTVELSSSIKTIGKAAFWECVKLEKISGPEVSVINEDAFYMCEKLSTFQFPMLKEIKEGGFYYSGLVSLPDQKHLETMGESAFAYCSKLKTIGELPNLKVIDDNCFTDCVALESIGLSDKVTKIGWRALQDTLIFHMKLPDTLTHIDGHSLPDRLCSLEYNPNIKRTGSTLYFDKIGIMDDAIKEMQITDADTDIDKIGKIHDWMVKNISYSYKLFYKAWNDISDTNDAGYVALKSKFAICSAYSEAFKLFMDRFGIENIIVSSSSMNHAWNMVKLDDGHWYHVDVTWDDPGYSDTTWEKGWLNYQHLVCTDEEIGKNHHGWQGEGIPKANGTKYANYFDHSYMIKLSE